MGGDDGPAHPLPAEGARARARAWGGAARATGAYRAVAVLTPKPGQKAALERFTVQSLPAIRAIPGLLQVEASRPVGGPARLVLYYWWESPAASAAYMEGHAGADRLGRCQTA